MTPLFNKKQQHVTHYLGSLSAYRYMVSRFHSFLDFPIQL